MGEWIGWVRDDRGQSLVEFALALPVLLLLLLGLADLGRAFYYTSAIANAARVGAEYAARATVNSPDTAFSDQIKLKACNETGFVPYNDAASCAASPIDVPNAQFGPGQDAVVTVTYDFQLISAYLVSRVFATPTLTLRATATFPSLN
ncbi:MAG: TadE/TadG family type IV pilus assembly protein [Candidatus Limnocylindria bacterium]